MKRFSTFILMTLILSIFAINESFAAKRWGLMEEFTNASCVPCASQNPSYQNFLNQNLDNFIPLTFHPNFPGRDAMYNSNPTMEEARLAYYPVDGVPTTFVNGKAHTPSSTWYAGAPGDITGLTLEIGKYLGAQSPIEITPVISVNGRNADISVTVTSSTALSNKILRIALVEGYHYYESAGTNGEKNFYYVVREMFPNASGQSITLTAGESKDFDYTYEMSPELFKQFVYVVAFVQDDATKEVLQAGKSEMPDLSQVENMPKVSLNINVNASQKHGFVEAGKSQNRVIKVQNPNNKMVKAGLLANKDFIPADWNMTLDKSEVEIPAGGTVDVNVTINAGSTIAYGSIQVDVFPIDLSPNELPIFKSGAVYALSKTAKYIYMTGTCAHGNYLQTCALNSAAYKTGVAFVPGLDIEALVAYPADNFEVLIFDFDINGVAQAKGLLGSNYTQSAAMRNYIKDAMNAGKDVMIAAEYETYNTFQTPDYVAGKSFFQSFIGVSSSQTIPRVVNNKLVSFKVQGTANDPISNGLNLSCNNHQYSVSFYTWQTDVLQLENNSKAIPFLYMDNDPAKICGVRFEETNGSKLVFMTAPFGSYDINSAIALYTKIMDWFMTSAAVGPKIAVTATALDFGTTYVNQKTNKSFTISNDGDQDLFLNSIMIENDAASVFTITAGDNVTKLAPKQVLNVEVEFAPKAKKNYTAKLRVQSNANNTPDIQINMQGIGDVETHVGEIGSKFFLNVYPNPVNSVSAINYEINNDLPVNLTLSLVNSQGNVVAELYNGVASNGTYSINLNSANYPAGAYFLSVLVDGEVNNIPVVIIK